MVPPYQMGNLTVSDSVYYQSIFGTIPSTSGKQYFEVTPTALTTMASRSLCWK